MSDAFAVYVVSAFGVWIPVDFELTLHHKWIKLLSPQQTTTYSIQMK